MYIDMYIMCVYVYVYVYMRIHIHSLSKRPAGGFARPIHAGAARQGKAAGAGQPAPHPGGPGACGTESCSRLQKVGTWMYDELILVILLSVARG